MTGLFHSDWLGCCPSSLLAHSWERERRKNPASPPHYRGELRVDFTGFLDSAEAELSRDTPPPTSQLCNCSTLQQIQDKLL
jgi:hypothetical protein